MRKRKPSKRQADILELKAMTVLKDSTESFNGRSFKQKNR